MKAGTMRSLRQWHLYLGLFFAPMLLLFAFSGALQVFRLNEDKGYGGPPPVWMVWIAAIHKNQAPPREKPADQAASKPHAPADKQRSPVAKGNSLPLKILATIMAASLALSTLLGILIALNNRATRWTGIVLLIAGTALPIVLLKL